MLCKKNGGLIGALIGIMVALMVANKSHADQFQGMEVTRSGQGAAIVFIPGLNSAAQVFSDTCASLSAHHSCYLVQLPGFAGLPPQLDPQQDFLTSMSTRIEAYLRAQKLKHVTLIGHSLGGTLSLMIAQHAPELVEKLVIVDALPYYPAIQNPALTVELMRPQAEQMRTQMTSQSDEDFHRNALASLGSMSNNAARLPLLTQWMNASDRHTTTAAMYSMMVNDLRQTIGSIKAPTLVLGAWAAYKNFGATKESTKAVFTGQYAALKHVDIRLSDTGFHFLMWDDANWLQQQIKDFIK